MSPRRRRGRGPANPGTAPRPPQPRAGGHLRPRVGRLAWVAVALLAIAAGSWLLARRPPRARPLSAESWAGSDAIARLPAEIVFRTADSLGRAGRHVASLPYYRQSLRNVRSDFWQLHFNYGTALYNATLEIETRHGAPVYVLRSSWERVAQMDEAMREMLAAERLARTPHDLALVRAARARMLWLWGLPWETFVAFRQAQAADPTDRAMGLQADRYMDLMHEPATSGLAEPVPEAPASR
jgi:hypothetical protein